MIKDYSGRRVYKEVIFSKNPDSVIDDIKNEIAFCRTKILQRGALPIFATIPKLNLELYNKFLVDDNRTSDLRYTHKYPEMQSQIDLVIDRVNVFICETNRKLEVSIPFLHTTIMKRRGSKGKAYYKYLWDLMYDGLHAGNDLKKLWGESLTVAIQKNRAKDYDSDENKSPKRSWRQEKRPRLN